LAAALTRDVQAVHRDGHLKIYAQSVATGAQPQMMMVSPQAQQRPAGTATPGQGKPIEEARWLAPGIAYIRFTIFPLDAAVTAAAEKFMKDHADASTVIFDMRTNKGGGMAQSAVMLPYLFDEETVFVAQDTRASVARAMGGSFPPWMRAGSSSKEGIATTEIFVRPHPSERRLFDAKVYVLTSGFTASAAEAFAFGLKTTGRATLIGQNTTGGGHFAPPGQRVNEMFAAFVPVGRAYDPRTGKGWERTGVAPDIIVPAEQALVEALVRSGVARTEAERLSASVRPSGPMNRPAQAS
jgi:C-terminal processing protease CtpA/Prc